MRLTKDISPSRAHKQWSSVLEEFGKLLNEYNSDRDVAYWYGERALTGLLAAAAWRVKGWWSLEEFTGLRRTGGRQNAGRGDVWIGVGQRTFTVEAKMLWPQGLLNTAISDARKLLDAAGGQLDSLDGTYQEDVPTAVYYLVPEFNVNGRHATPQQMKQLFTEVPRVLTTRNRYVGAFWYKSEPPQYKGKTYPGIIVAAQFWSRWPRRKRDN